MKTKNIFLAIIAFTFAVGNAFASMLVDTAVFVWAKRTSGGVFQCTELNVDCNDAPSSNLCEVQFPVTKPGVGYQTATSTSFFKTYKDNVCTIVLFDATYKGLQPASAKDGGAIYELGVPE